jgi:hypothetical protein
MSPPRDWPYPFTRLYGQITAGRMTCPECSNLIVWGGGRKGSRAEFNPLTSILTCRQCQRSFQVGLLLWSVRPGPRRRPRDHRPTLREQAQLLARAGGFWADEQEKKRSDEPANRYIRGECCCDPLPWRAECPIHGSEVRRDDDGDQEA